jgi:hypothetical protein
VIIEAAKALLVDRPHLIASNIDLEGKVDRSDPQGGQRLLNKFFRDWPSGRTKPVDQSGISASRHDASKFHELDPATLELSDGGRGDILAAELREVKLPSENRSINSMPTDQSGRLQGRKVRDVPSRR